MAWGHDMVGHAEKFVERCCELACKSAPAFKLADTPCMMIIKLLPNISTVQRIGTNMCTNCVAMLVLGQKWQSRSAVDSEYSCSISDTMENEHDICGDGVFGIIFTFQCQENFTRQRHMFMMQKTCHLI